MISTINLRKASLALVSVVLVAIVALVGADRSTPDQKANEPKVTPVRSEKPPQIEQTYDKIRADMGAVPFSPEHDVPTSVWTQLSGFQGGRGRASLVRLSGRDLCRRNFDE